ncbi:glycerophosphoinositol inositolphosphodiesterase GDPD2 [Austrofundulus limnaeus]|uniref:Glycerophosphoinositol inositolphosphodiesterase GDPD2 n=1 Tax=Austrofundulus limnaeus TaxID=52670 RepID=A0A2I4AYQ2_AUSLI|nr:PREDICTED: glycerophosphoinositol inositolphosphodiesterase GDPD2-like [Austrofundulus limnaeus]
MYICFATYNDRDDINSKGFSALKMWVNWSMLLIVVSAMFTSYSLLLLFFALVQVILRERLVLHWLHKIFLSVGVIFGFLLLAGICYMWKQEVPTIPLSLQATGPFLQFGAVGALTLLSSFVFHAFTVAQRGSKFLIAAAFFVVSAAIFLWPLFIKSPCLISVTNLPDKPKLIGHRGAPMLAPENTMMSFQKSIECGVTAFETDVQVCNDGIGFLMHDHNEGFLERTTNIKQKFPNIYLPNSSYVNFTFLRGLNAGEWFLKTDPFNSIHLLSKEEKETARNQIIPSLLELLQLAKNHSISVIFDLYSSGRDDVERTLETILSSGIDHHLIYWLPPINRSYVKRRAPGFIQIYNNESEMTDEGAHHLNMMYNNLSTEKIRELRSKNISVNLWTVNERWLFSLLWCAGASSVTTNSCHLLKDMEQPHWTMEPSTYRTIWIVVNISSILIMIFLCILQQKLYCFGQKQETQNNNSLWKEMLSLTGNPA